MAKKTSATSANPAPDITLEPGTNNIEIVTAPKEYPVPETKQDYLALHQLLKDLGVNSIGDLEVKASRL